MQRLSLYPMTVALFCLAQMTQAQTADLVFFTDDGARFTLLVDGDVKNAEPASRVVATGIRTETPVVIVRFEDAAIPQLRKPGYFPLGKEYTVMITTNKKGDRVLRPTGEADLGTAAKATPPPPTPDHFVEVEGEPADHTTQIIAPGVVQQTTVTTTTQEGGMGENVSIGVGVNGVGLNMSVGVTDGTGKSTTTVTQTTTTTTTTSSTHTVPEHRARPAKAPEVYSMPGYTGPVGCGWPMNTTEYADAKQSIASKSFEADKLTTAKQVGRDRCFTVEQVKGIVGLFTFEGTKLDFAKYAYEHTFDIGNYYKLNDAFTFSSSIDELNSHIQAR